ncbi:Glycosyltransferase involved in cell wall bisynthesis [Singulisphaera sp. GP187]|uniref:glycosyltransferase family 4 protein n=1 Tax=Singulisphaera sp. GP187 TaxID=1882752 RepID=UPI00092C26D6|nr:glycosyltransferase family 4 protein [Singulisphaera sp. GP187]SIO55305.1 Glycosyltransferase involved in cell wall bisynthesis [Singulisphaera sp. GP187]
MDASHRLAILASHPIQYQAPFFRHLAARPGVDLTVFFCADFGLKPYDDPGFGTRIQWDIPLLDGYQHVILRNRSRSPRAGRFWGAFNPEIRTRLQTGGFDALVVHGWALATNWLAFRSSRALGLPVFLRGESNGLSEPTGLRRLVKRTLLTRLFRSTAGFMAIGSLNRRFYRDYGVDEGRIFLAPYSVDNASFQEQDALLTPRRSELRAEESIPDGATVFLFCGKLSPVKRPLDLLEAFARLPDVGRHRLIYAGDGVLRDAILRRAGALGLNNVRITGFLNQSELPRYYALADALVLPSSYEPWGLVVNEAMNFGLPVVVSDRLGSAPDLVREGENGFVVPCGDVPALARRLEQLAGDRDQRIRMGERSRALIATWGIPQTADGYLEGLRTVVGRGRNSSMQGVRDRVGEV